MKICRLACVRANPGILVRDTRAVCTTDDDNETSYSLSLCV